MLSLMKEFFAGMTTQMIVGNIIALVGSLVMVGLGFIKKKNHVLLGQCVQNVLLGTSNLILGGVSGFITNVLTIIRNLIAVKVEFKLPLKLLFMAAQIALTAIFNNLGWVGWMPTVAACLFIWFLDTKSDLTMKIVVIVTQVMWTIFDWTICSYTTLLFDFFTMASNAVGIILILRDNSNKRNAEE